MNRRGQIWKKAITDSRFEKIVIFILAWLGSGIAVYYRPNGNNDFWQAVLLGLLFTSGGYFLAYIISVLLGYWRIYKRGIIPIVLVIFGIALIAYLGFLVFRLNSQAESDRMAVAYAEATIANLEADLENALEAVASSEARLSNVEATLQADNQPTPALTQLEQDKLEIESLIDSFAQSITSLQLREGWDDGLTDIYKDYLLRLRFGNEQELSDYFGGREIVLENLRVTFQSVGKTASATLQLKETRGQDTFRCDFSFSLIWSEALNKWLIRGDYYSAQPSIPDYLENCF